MAAPAHTVLENGLQTRPGPSLLLGPDMAEALTCADSIHLPGRSYKSEEA